MPSFANLSARCRGNDALSQTVVRSLSACSSSGVSSRRRHVCSGFQSVGTLSRNAIDVGRRIGHFAGRVAGRVLFRDRIEEHVRHHRARIVMVRRLHPAIEPALPLVRVELGRQPRQVGALRRVMPGKSSCEWHARQPRDSNSHLPRSADGASVTPCGGSMYSNGWLLASRNCDSARISMFSNRCVYSQVGDLHLLAVRVVNRERPCSSLFRCS